jgi:plastocyanin domain-containing protein
MTAWKLAPAALVAAALAFPRPSLACEECDKGVKVAQASAPKAAAPAKPAKATAKKADRTLELTVTEDGFTPAEVKAKAGETVKLVVTRKVERTCATDIVSKDLGVNQALPLDKPVTVNLTPKKAGEYRFACAMDMIAGTLKVE